MRTWATRLLAVVGALLIGLGVLSGTVNREVLDGERFARHVDQVRSDPDAARQLGLLVSQRVLDQQPELVAVRPLVESASTAVVASPALGPVVRAAIAPMHRALVSGDDDHVVLRLADVGALLVAAIRALDPDSTAAIPDQLDVTLSAIGGREATAELISLAHLVSVLSWALPLLGVGLLGGSVLLRRAGIVGMIELLRRVLLWVAVGIGVLTLVVTAVVSRLDADTLTGAVGGAVWRELDGSLWRSAALLFAASIVLAVVGRPDLTLSSASLGDAITRFVDGEALGPRALAMRALVVVLTGAALIVQPAAAITVAAVALGVVVLVIGVRDLWHVARDAVRTTRPSPPRLESTRRGVVAAGAAGAVLVGVVVLGAWPTSADLPAAATAADTTACNGHDALCDRAYDQVAFPATHNSMSAADGPGWYLPEQPTGVMGQLDDGIRVFLIDSWPGQSTSQPGIVANSPASRAAALEAAEEAFGPAVVASARRLHDALDLTPRGPVEPYLCHALCELGSTEWIPLMKQVKAWMDAHPREVVTFFIQDELSPVDTAAVFDEAGMTPMIHTQERGADWPTLAEMVETGERVVVLHEHVVDEDAVPWLLDGKTWVQDTPYEFYGADDFSCDLLRGREDSPLFLVNHWLSNQASRIADATEVNAEAVLLTRLRECQAERGQIPNFVAVNNYDRGDVVASVEAINGLD